MTSARELRRRRLRRTAVLATAALVVVGGAAAVLTREDATLLVQRCTATTDGVEHRLAPDQAASAALIAGRALQRGLPPRAVTIGIATAIQESRLRNIDYGDRDSLGLFQQRPSQGWGTPEQVLDPVYATDAFFDGLVEVEGYETLEITDAAQRVQRSGFPTAYADHEPEARAFASALTGYSPAALGCRLRAPDVQAEQVGDGGLTPRAAALADAAAAQLGLDALAPSGPEGTVLAADLGADEAGTRAGWSLAQWAVARADEADLVEVTTDGRRWTPADVAWQPVADGAGPGRVELVVATGG